MIGENAINIDHMSYDRIDFRSSTRAFLFKSGTGWFLLLITILSLFIASIVTLPILIVKWLENKTSKFSLGSDRLFMRRGILIRCEEEIELYRIKDIKVDFSIIQQLFGNGNIVVISSDATGQVAGNRTSFEITNVEQARFIREELRSRVEAARSRVGVREFDVT